MPLKLTQRRVVFADEGDRLADGPSDEPLKSGPGGLDAATSGRTEKPSGGPAERMVGDEIVGVLINAAGHAALPVQAQGDDSPRLEPAWERR